MASQMQWELERRIRKSKREYLALDTAGLDTTQAAATLAKRRQALKEFLKETGLRQDNFRQQVAGFGRSQASKADWTVRHIEKQKEYGILIEKLRQAGNLKKAAQIHLTSRSIDLDSLLFDDKHINAERAHNVTEAQAKRWILNAKISVTVWNGQFERYYNESGTVYVDLRSPSIRTAYAQDEYDEKVCVLSMEVIKENGL